MLLDTSCFDFCKLLKHLLLVVQLISISGWSIHDTVMVI